MTTIDHTELPSMLATLCSYENLFGPYHPQTLRLMAEVANAYWQVGELGRSSSPFGAKFLCFDGIRRFSSQIL